jgi:hypothetical protein
MKSSYYVAKSGHLIRKYRYFIFIAIFSILPILFLSGTMISDPKPILEINPIGYAEELFNVWSPHELGYAHGHDVSYLPLALVFSALSQIFSTMLIQRIFFFFVFFVAGYSFFLLARNFSLDNRFALLGSLFYMYNFYPLMWFGDGSSTMLLPYAFCPLFLFLTMKALNEKKLIYVIYIAGISGMFGGINPPQTVIAFIPAIIYLIIHLERGNYFPIKYTVALLFTVALANIYWLIPGLNAIISSGPGALNLFVETPALDNRYSSVFQVFRLLGHWGFFEGWQGVWYYQYAPFYNLNLLGIALSYVIPALAMAGLVIRRSFTRKYLFLVSLLVLAIPMAVGAYPVDSPWLNGQIYLWLYNNVPLFEAFRNTYKFVMLIALVYAILFPSFLQDACKRLPSFKEKIKRLKFLKQYATPTSVLILGMLLVLVTYWPAWTGGIENSNRSFQVPSYYGEAASYFENDPGKAIMLTPYRFGSNYNWGVLAGGGEVFEALLSTPVIDENPNTANVKTPGNLFVNLAYSSIYANQTASLPILMDYLGVEYLVQQNDINISVYGSLDPVTMKNILMSTPGLTYQGSYGELDVYKRQTTHEYVEAYGTAKVIQVDANRSLASYIVNTSIIQSNIASNSWYDCSIRSYANISGDFTVETKSSLIRGEGTALFIIFSDNEYAVFSASSSSGSGSGLYFYKNGTLIERMINQSAVYQMQELHDLEVKRVGETYEFAIDGLVIGDYTLFGSIGGTCHVGLGTFRGVASYEQLITRSTVGDTVYRFNYSDLSSQDDFKINGGTWSIVASNQPTSSNASTVLITSDQTEIIGTLPKTLTLPAELDYTYNSPVDISVDVKGSSGPFILVLKTTMDNWKCTVNGQTVSEENHFTANGYQNAWLINATGNLSITLTYVNQSYHISMIVSGIFITIALTLTMVMVVTGSTKIIFWKKKTGP